MKCTELDIAGKTVESISYPDPWSEGLTIVFTDGSKLNVYERMQAGEIIATYNEEMIVHERDFEWHAYCKMRWKGTNVNGLAVGSQAV